MQDGQGRTTNAGPDSDVGARVRSRGVNATSVESTRVTRRASTQPWSMIHDPPSLPPFTLITNSASGLPYHEWQQGRAVVRGRAMGFATKPGLFSHGHDDPAAVMLSEAVADVLTRAPETVRVALCLNAGNGLVGLVAARAGASTVWMTDRQLLAHEACQRTIAMASDAYPLKDISRRVHCVLGQGTFGIPAGVTADVVTIRVVPERLVMQQLLHDAVRALRPGGRCLLAGGSHEGVKSAVHAMESLFGAVRVDAQHSSHRLVSAVRPDTLPSSAAAIESPFGDPDHFHFVPVALQGFQFTLYSRPGVFSWEHLDEASEVLAGLIDVQPGERVLDIGCGAGALGTVAALQSRTGAVYLVDADSEAVRCATRTLEAARVPHAQALVSDVASAVSDQTFDVVVANPPFHVGKHTDLDVPRQFIREARERLRPGGRLLLVANRTLPYEGAVQAEFGMVRTRHNGRRFKVLGATCP